jgi:hypothetical protein
MQSPAPAKTLMIVGILIVLIAALADPLGLGLLASGGGRRLESSSVLWSSRQDSICGGGWRPLRRVAVVSAS